jgi:integrase
LRNTVSAIFTFAKGLELWERPNPCEGVKVGRKSVVREKRIFTRDQFKAFRNAFHDTRICSAEGAQLIARTAFMTGFRISEVLGLQAADLDTEMQTVTVRRRWHRGDVGEPKTEKSRRTQIIGPLAAELALLARGKPRNAFLFAREGGNPPDDRDLQQHIFRPAAEAVGIYHPGFGMHSFRRLHITKRQQVAGATPFEAQKAAGHASFNMTYDYTLMDEERERDQVQRLWDWMEDEK